MVAQINQALIEELIMSPLCIDSKYAQALIMSAYSAYSTGKPLSKSRYESAYAINPQSGAKESENFSVGSVGMVVIDGPIVSASDPWNGIKGTIEAGQELLALEADNNVIGTVLYLESGGGAVYALKPIKDILSQLTKPLVIFSKHILGSAAYAIAAEADFIMMYHPQGIVGSIGTMSSFSDMEPMFEKWGMKFHEYYATDSILKNKTFRDAKKGDGKALIANMLDPMNDLFIADIKRLRGDKISSKNEAIYQGETFMADPQGLSLGLIDGTGSLHNAIAKVVELANNPSSQNSSRSNNSQKSSNMFGFNKFSKLGALSKVAAASITAETVLAINEEIVAEGIEGVTLCLDSQLETIDAENKAASAAVASLKVSQDQVTALDAEKVTLTAEKANADAQIVSLTAELATANAKVIEYGGKPAASHTSGTKEGDDAFEGTEITEDFLCEADAELAELKAKTKVLPSNK